MERYEEMGIEGLLKQSRAPSNHPNKTKEEVVNRILKEALYFKVSKAN